MADVVQEMERGRTSTMSTWKPSALLKSAVQNQAFAAEGTIVGLLASCYLCYDHFTSNFCARSVFVTELTRSGHSGLAQFLSHSSGRKSTFFFFVSLSVLFFR